MRLVIFNAFVAILNGNKNVIGQINNAANAGFNVLFNCYFFTFLTEIYDRAPSPLSFSNTITKQKIKSVIGDVALLLSYSCVVTFN